MSINFPIDNNNKGSIKDNEKKIGRSILFLINIHIEIIWWLMMTFFFINFLPQMLCDFTEPDALEEIVYLTKLLIEARY